jgi:hypothetical protein
MAFTKTSVFVSNPSSRAAHSESEEADEVDSLSFQSFTLH